MLTLSRTSLQTLAGTVKVAFRITALVIVLALHAISLPAHVGNLNAADAKCVCAVIECQLAAFAKDDANKAFSFAAPNVRKALGSAVNFMSMVRSDYPLVYRPSSEVFLTAVENDGDVTQRMQMVDSNGNAWLASYSLQKQKD